MQKIIGIDFGTSHTRVAVMEEGSPVVIGSIPSWFGIDKDGNKIAGQKAQSSLPENAVHAAKRLLGRKFTEVDPGGFIFELGEGPSGEAMARISGKLYSPIEIVSQILAEAKNLAEEYLGHEVSDIVISASTYFHSGYRTALRQAAEMAGLSVVRMISDHAAAALAFGFGLKDLESVKVAIIDLGGGTFDFSVFEYEEGIYEILTTAGDLHLGGKDIDRLIIEEMISVFKKEHGVDLRTDLIAMGRLKKVAEKEKIDFSNAPAIKFNIPFLYANVSGPLHLDQTLSSQRLKKLITPLLVRCQTHIKNALKEAKIDSKEINKVILVGGTSRHPLVEEFIKPLFPNSKRSRLIGEPQDVAIGAAIQAGILSGEVKGQLLLDVNPLPLGIETVGGVMSPMIPANTTIPTIKSEVFSTSADNQSYIEIHLLQGKGGSPKDNVSLGRFVFDGILPALKGVPQIELDFDLQPDFFTVTAREKGTGKEKSSLIYQHRSDEGPVRFQQPQRKKTKAPSGRSTEKSSTTETDKLVAKTFFSEIFDGTEKKAAEPEKEVSPEYQSSKLFLSYRRDDSQDVTSRLFDHLVGSFGRENVMVDVDNIPLGMDFRIHLDKMVSQCDIFLAIIGPEWLGTQGRGKSQTRRIDSQKDFVRYEIESALKRNIPIIPILVKGASMPEENDLPESIKELSFRNGAVIRSGWEFNTDTKKLIAGIEKSLTK
ncbi:Hsp70 family protein [bacterium]|nr:Hsp70 family protein [bacterium]